MLRGLTTVNYFADDVPAAVAWYTQVLGVEPYFHREFPDGAPAYVEFRVGDHQAELGILNRRHFSPPPGGAMIYWAVDDLHATHTRLLTLGAREHLPPTEHGPGFTTASVTDPFGNVLGIMHNQHYLDMLTRHQLP